MGDLLSAEDTERLRLTSTVERMLQVADVVAMDVTIFSIANHYRSRFGLTIDDAIVLASIIHALRPRPVAEPRCFISRNWGDFDEAGIRAELDNVGTTYLSNFRRGLEFCQPR